jgi:hypothetical protein
VPLTFIIPELVFTFLCKVYEKQDYFNRKDKNDEINSILGKI